MKKIGISIAFGLATLLQAGFYMGIEGGYNTSKQIFDYKDQGTDPDPDFTANLKGNGYVANITLGTEHSFIDKYLVIRWGIFGGYGQTIGKTEGEKDILETISFGVNADLIANFIAKEKFTAGIFAGAEYMYSILKPKPTREVGQTIYTTYPDGSQTKTEYYVNNNISSDNFVLRAGLTFLANNHHRFDIFTKIPLTFKEDSSSFYHRNIRNGKVIDVLDFKSTYRYEFIQALMSYKYIF